MSSSTSLPSAPAAKESEKNARKPIKILVIQLARLGDTLQSLMALRAAQQLYPDLEIHFVARERFAAAAKRVPWIKSVFTLPTDALLGPVIKGEKTETQGLGDLARWIGPLVKEPWDFVVNWSFSEASSFLTGLMPARVKLGYTRRRDSTFCGADGWSHYVQGIVQGGIPQNIHLTDILTTQLLTALQIHIGDPLTDGNSPVTSKGFFSLEVTDQDLGRTWGEGSRKHIAIQMGAGKDEKTWDAESWAKLSSFIMKRHPECSIVLLGGKEDAAREKIFLAALQALGSDVKAVTSLVGKTSFDLWASVVSRSQWLFAGDTAAIHLASVLGTRILNISVGPVRWSETGPYGNGHYVVSSSLACEACDQMKDGIPHTCRESVTPEAVYAVWSYASNEWAHHRQISLENHFSQLGWSAQLGSVRVHRSKIRNTSDGGGVSYEPVIQRQLRLSDWTAMSMGHVARAWYCGWVPKLGQEMARESISPILVQKLRGLSEASEVFSKICEEAKRTALSLNKKSSALRSDKVMGIRDREDLRDLGKKLMDLDRLIERMGNNDLTLKAYSQMAKVLMHNLRGDQLADLGRETAECYRQLYEGITMLREWVKFTLDLAKPMAIKSIKATSHKEINP